MTRAEEVAAAVSAVRARIEAAARRAARDPAGITLVAASKTRPLEDLLFAFDAGVRDFGENRVQEAEAKFPHLPAGVTRHLLGPVQSNKAARAARAAGVLHSVDSVAVAERLDRAASSAGKRLAVYVEVNTGGEETKAGVAPEEAPALVARLLKLPALELLGLMSIPPPGETRPHFVTLRGLARELGLSGLSMGMTDDFEAAVEEGATVVRIGTALFGRRPAA